MAGGNLALPARLLLVLALLLPASTIHAQEPELESRVQTLLSTMTIEERVGQLFLVTFTGSSAIPGSDIARLVRQDHVGGVILAAANANFTNDEDAPRQVAALSNDLQALTMTGGAQIPLFVAVEHEGDGYPHTAITGGATPLPNAMAIGATWDPDNAHAIGRITGLELAAMGVNLLLGPGVDVLHTPQPGAQGDIGARTFGGDPWWVGQMGRAYIEGVHQGSSDRVATVAKHFPGHGGSDRLPEEQVATLDKSIGELLQVELVPFVAVTEAEAGGGLEGTTDALMSSHIRYRAMQGDVRRFTEPLSLDADALGDILALPEFSAWRQTGLMVSDSLGSPAVQKYFDPTLSSFPHRRIAKEAFLAGNDLLMLSEFALTPSWPDQLHNIRDTIAFFRDEYRSNPAFAARVDESAARILYLKIKLYPEFTPEAVQIFPEAARQVCGLGIEVTQTIAGSALTLLYPDLEAMPAAPRLGEKILIFTDARPVRECEAEQCQPYSPLSQTVVEEAVLHIYGPGGTGQVAAEDIASLPFGQLKRFLDDQEVEYDVGGLLQDADWILFAQQDLNLEQAPNSDTVTYFLNHSKSAAYEAQLVVLALNAPYYLDTTEVSRLSLYLGAYSKVEPFVEASVRALFGELVPPGASPVDVRAINYDLQRRLSPAPEQTIPLVLVEPDTALLRAGPVLDRNGHTVPDGTLVTFFAEYDSGVYAPPVSAPTVDGLAEAVLSLPEAGQVRFRVESGEARQSQEVVLTLQPPATATRPPTRTPAATPTTAPTSTWTPVPPASPTSVPATPTPDRPTPPAAGTARPADGLDLLLAVGATLVVALAGYLLLGKRRRQPDIVVRWLALAVVGGMAGYLLYALGAIRPEAWAFLPQGTWSARLVVAGLAGLGALVLLPLVLRGEAT